MNKYMQYQEMRQEFVKEVKPLYMAHVRKVASDVLCEIEDNAEEDDKYVDALGIQVDDWQYVKEDIADLIVLECARQPFSQVETPIDVWLLSPSKDFAFKELASYPKDEASDTLLALIAFIKDVETQVDMEIVAANQRRAGIRADRDRLIEVGWSHHSYHGEMLFSKAEFEDFDLESALIAEDRGAAHITCSRCGGCGEGVADHVSCAVCRGRGEIEVTL